MPSALFGRRPWSLGGTPKFAQRGFLQWLTCIPAAVGGKRGRGPTEAAEEVSSDKEKPQSLTGAELWALSPVLSTASRNG